MLLVTALLAPLVLLVLLLVMERVERPLRAYEIGDDLEGFLETARPDEVETFVSEGYGPALQSYWRRRRMLARLRRGT